MIFLYIVGVFSLIGLCATYYMGERNTWVFVNMIVLNNLVYKYNTDLIASYTEENFSESHYRENKIGHDVVDYMDCVKFFWIEDFSKFITSDKVRELFEPISIKDAKRERKRVEAEDNELS